MELQRVFYFYFRCFIIAVGGLEELRISVHHLIQLSNTTDITSPEYASMMISASTPVSSLSTSIS